MPQRATVAANTGVSACRCRADRGRKPRARTATRSPGRVLSRHEAPSQNRKTGVCQRLKVAVSTSMNSTLPATAGNAANARHARKWPPRARAQPAGGVVVMVAVVVVLVNVIAATSAFSLATPAATSVVHIRNGHG